MITVKTRLLHPDARLPTYGSVGAACFDFYAYVPNKSTLMLPNEPVDFPTGVSREIPEGWVLLLYSRSGHAFKSDIRLSNCVGVIDSDYRGEIRVRLVRDCAGDALPHYIDHGDRIAQGMLVPATQARLEIVDTLSTTARGAGGMGSTGK